MPGVLPPRARAIAEGRTERKPPRPRPGRARGERNGRAKLTWAQVTEIRARLAAGGITKRALGMEYGVSEVLIGLIARGKAWEASSTPPTPQRSAASTRDLSPVV